MSNQRTSTALGTSTGEVCAPDSAALAMSSDAAATIAATLKALADPLRLRMLSVLASTASAEACVCDLAELADVSQPTVSHHLRVLKDVGVIEGERRGTWVYYRIAEAARPAVTALLEGLAPAAMRGAAAPSVPAVGPSGLADADAALDRIATRLAAEFPSLEPTVVTSTVRESYAALHRTSRIPGHVVVLAERFARQRLGDHVRASGADVGRPPQVLFVCVANAGRSQLAAALLHHYAGEKVEVRSAGSSPAGSVHASVSDVLAQIRAGAGDEPFPKPLTDDAVRASDVIVTMGCGDACPILPGKRYEEWVVPDPALASPDGVRQIIGQLDGRVRALLAELTPTLDLPAPPAILPAGSDEPRRRTP